MSARPQTTRHLVTGILTRPGCQYVFVDAPGQQTSAKSTLHRRLNRRATEAARDSDVALFVVEALRFGAEDHAVLDKIPPTQRVVAAVNKIDTIRNSSLLIPFLDRLSKTRQFEAIVPVSAKTGRNIPELLAALRETLPEGAAAYPPDQLTDRDERFFAAELLREKIFTEMGEEMPYRCEVVIDSFKEEEGQTAAHRGHDPGRARQPEADRARRRRRAPETHGHGGAQGHGEAFRRQGVSGHVGESAQGLDR